MSLPVERLQSFQIFHGVSDECCRLIREALTRESYPAGATILKEGSGAPALWLITAGDCMVVRTNHGSDPRTLAVLKSGDVFGEMSFLRSAPHSADVIAQTAVDVWKFTRAAYLALVKKSPEAACQIACNISGVLSERLRRMDQWVCRLVEGLEKEEHQTEWDQFRSAVYRQWEF